jgi:predicted N-acyltransferase
VRRAQREGVEVRIDESPDDLSEFISLYEVTMRRQEAADYYFFPREYWERFQRDLRSKVVVVEGVLEGKLIASLLCLRDGTNLHYHLGASADEARTTGASVLCFYEAAIWGQRERLQCLHLGGGVGGGRDSLHEFKHRFDEDGELAMRVGKQVLDQPAYRELAGSDDTSGFFPAYRRLAVSA